MPPKPLPAVPPHPAVRQSLSLFALAALMLLGGVFQLGSSDVWMGPFLFAIGGTLIWFGRFVRQSGPAAQAVNIAHNLATAGRIAEADERYAEADARTSLRYIRRVIAVNRAWVALRRGDLERAVAFSGEAITRPVQWITRQNERINIVEARGIRAVALASLGDAALAEQDIAAILESPLASPTALARAELSRALLLEQAGDRAALGAHLAKNRRLLLEHTHPRERAIVRAYQRMLEAQATSVYRHGAPREPAPRDEPALSDWVAKLAPGAASFVRAEVTQSAGTGDQEPRARVSPGMAAAVRARFDRKSKGGGGRGAKTLGLWMLLIMMFLAIWQFLAPEHPAPAHVRVPMPERADPSILGALIPLLLTVVILGLVLVFIFARQKKQPSGPQILTALATLARGDEAAALKMLTTFSSGPPFVAAHALLTLAAEMERTGDLREAQDLCEQGIAKAQSVAAVAFDHLLPSLFAEHALLLAAQGESAQAEAELALIEERYPTFALLDAARFRVTLVDRARQRDFAGAARIAARSADLPLRVREELLADLVRVIADPEAGGSGEMDRLRKELRTDAVSRAWIEKVAPAVIGAFEHAGSDARTLEASRDEEAEREHLAEEEAHAAALHRA